MIIQKKEEVSKVFQTVWSIAKKYCFEEINDALWEKYIDETASTREQFKHNDEIDHLYRDMVYALTKYMERRQKNERMDTGTA